MRCQCPTHTMEWSGDTCTDSWETWNCSPVTATRPEATFNFTTLNFEVRLASHCKTTGCYPITKLPDNSKQKAQHVKTVKNGMLTKVDDDRSRQRCLKNRPSWARQAGLNFLRMCSADARFRHRHARVQPSISRRNARRSAFTRWLSVIPIAWPLPSYSM